MTLLAGEAKLEIDTSSPSGKPIRNKAARLVNDVEILYVMLDAINEIHFKTYYTHTGGNVYQCVILFFSKYPFFFHQTGE